MSEQERGYRKGGRTGREGEPEGERRRRREESAKIPSHGSLQQAFKVRPKRGQGERKEEEKGSFWVPRFTSAAWDKNVFCPQLYIV